jgi:hypothetical protein
VTRNLAGQLTGRQRLPLRGIRVRNPLQLAAFLHRHRPDEHFWSASHDHVLNVWKQSI